MARAACLLIPTDLWQQRTTPGPYLRAMRQVEYLCNQGREVHVVSWIRWLDSPLAKLPEREERDGVRVQRLVLAPPSKGLAGRALFFRELTRRAAALAASTGAEGFVVHDPELLPAGLRAGKGKPVFYDAHEHFPGMVAQHNPLEARLIDWLERRASRKLAHVYTVSEGIADRFRGLGVPTTVTYNSKPLAQVERWRLPRAIARQEQGLREDEVVVAWMGSLAPDQGLDLLLDGLALAPANVRLVAHAGPPEEAAKLREQAKAKGLAGRVEVLAPIPVEQLYRKFSAYDVGALLLSAKGGPNFLYRAPLKLFDFLALGLPILATPLPDPRRIVESAGCGVIVEEDAKAVGHALGQVARDPERRLRMAEAGRAAFAASYCAERMEARLAASHAFWR